MKFTHCPFCSSLLKLDESLDYINLLCIKEKRSGFELTECKDNYYYNMNFYIDNEYITAASNYKGDFFLFIRKRGLNKCIYNATFLSSEEVIPFIRANLDVLLIFS